MKALRILLVGGAVLAALLIVAVLLAFTPSVQTWAARRVLANQPDLRGQLGQIAIGLNQVKVIDLRIERAGMILTLPSATIDLPVKAAAGKQVLVRRAVAKGWVLDLTAPAVLGATAPADPGSLRPASEQPRSGLPIPRAESNESSTPASSQPFEGVFKMLNLPIDLEVDAADLEGDVIFFTKAGGPTGRAHVTIAGGQLGAGRPGEFKITSVTKLSGPDAPINEVNLQTVLQTKMDTPRTFESVAGTIDLAASGPKFPNGAKLKGDLKAQHTGSIEEYMFTLQSVEASGDKQIVDLRGRYPVDSRQLTGTWKINARDVDLAPFALGTPIPAFVAVGEGRFETDNAFLKVHAVGTFETTLDKLDVLDPSLSVVGPIRVKGDFDLVQEEKAFRVERFSADVQGAKPIASIAALQPIEINPATRELKVADPTKDLFRIKIEGVPLAWAQAFVPGFTIRGDDLRGEMVGSARNGGLTVHSVSPLLINGLSVSDPTTPLIQAVDLSVALTADYSPSGWQADVAELLLRTAGTTWATLSAKAGQPAGEDQPIKATGQYQFDLPAALRQPALANLAQLTRGRATGDFSAVITTPLKQLGTKLELRDLVSPAATQPLPTVTLNMRADVQADGVTKVRAPVVVQQGDRKSDLDLTAEVRSDAAKGIIIDAQVDSTLLYVEDLQVLAAPFQPPPSATPPQTKEAPRRTPNGSSPTPPTQPATSPVPFWNGLNGQLKLALKKVVYSPDLQVADVSGAVKIGSDALSLDYLRAVLGQGSSVDVSGGLTFDAKAKESYKLVGDLNVTNLNPGPILAALSPQHEPTAEGQFDLVGKFSGDAARPDGLADKTGVDLKLTSRGGKFNGFAAGARATDVGRLQKATSTAATLLGLASGIIGENKVTVYAERVRALSDIVKRFVKIDFDQLNLELSHRPGEETKIKDFSLISPNLRFIGTGNIETVAGKKWWDQPLHLILDMAVRGEQADDLKLLGALQDTKDSLGYIPLTEKVPIDGTLSNLGTSSLMKFVMRFAPKTQ